MSYSNKQKVDLNVFKASHSLQVIANQYLNLSLKPEGIWQQCPCCQKKGSFIINRNQTYYCAKTNCDLHSPKAQDIFNLFQWAGYSYIETLNLLGINSNKATQLYKPDNKLYELFNVTKQQLLKNNKALDYLSSRYHLTKNDLNNIYFEIGYCDSLLELGFKTPRLIFPLYDSFGNLVHLHTRALDSLEEPRWLPTKTDRLGANNLLSFGNYLWNGYLHKDSPHLFLTEGISDGLILTKLGLPTVSLLSINSPLHTLLGNLKPKSLTVVLDNDTQPIGIASNKAKLTKYKSWHTVLPKLVEYNLMNPQVQIWCMMPPNKVGVKDINDWYFNDNLTTELFLNTVAKQVQLLPDFIVNNFWDCYTLHPKLIQLLKLLKLDSSIKNYLTHVSTHSLFDYLSLLTN